MSSTSSKPVNGQTTSLVKRGVSYRRVSTDEQASNYSLPSQLKEIEAYADRNSIRLVADFVDDHTGSSIDRPGLNEAREWLRSGKADVIIPWTVTG